MKKQTAIIIAMIFTAVCVLSACGNKNGGAESDSDEPLSLTDVHYGAEAGAVEKRENVYINIDPDGSVSELTVSDWLHADRSEVSVNDVTVLKNIKIVKGAASYQDMKNGAVTWELAGSDVYYQGTTDKELPVTLNITYKLDGEEISASELAGKSGRVDMEIRPVNNVSETVEIDGRQTTIYSPFVVLGGLIMPYENFSEISVGNGLTVGAGSNEIIVFTGAPGLAESLDLESSGLLDLEDYGNFSFDDTFTVSAKTENFALGDMYFIALPLSALGLDIEMPESVKDVRDLVVKIQDVASYLDEIDPNGVLESYVTDSAKFREVFDKMQTALTLYQNNKELIAAFTGVMTPENVEKLTKLAETLNTDKMRGMLEFFTNVSSLTSVIGIANDLSKDLSDVQPVLDELDEKLSDPTVKVQMDKLPETLEQLQGLTDYLNENAEALEILSNLTQSSSLNSLMDVLEKLSSSEPEVSLPENMDASSVVARAGELLKFDYGIYGDAPEGMSTSCIFIYKTAPF